MTTAAPVGAPAASPAPATAGGRRDRRGSWVPTGAMITTRFMELRKRRGLMVALILVYIGIPTVFLGVRLLFHALSPHSYGPAGGYGIYTGLVAGVMYLFGFLVAATLGCTAGSVDLTDGMFRHLVVTGRSRLALYLARIPAGLAVIVPLVAVGFSMVCAVCVFAAPPKINYDGASVPAGLSRSGFETWAGNNANLVICDLPYNGPINVNVPCGNGPGGPVFNGPPPSGQAVQSTPAVLKALAVQIADQDFSDYRTIFRAPSGSLMIESGLWLELEATIGFVVGLGLASLMGQRTVPVILLIVLEIILTPLFSRARIAHFSNLQRAVVGLATAHLAPGGLPVFGGGGGGPGGGHGSPALLPESTRVAVFVIVVWLVGWTAIGAWRMMTRDA
jgi:hypothetical protein